MTNLSKIAGALLLAATVACSANSDSAITSPSYVLSVTATECQPLLDDLKLQSEAVAISGKNSVKDREGLVKIVDAATIELAKGKNADAVTKLNDFKVKVGQLLTAGRITEADASSLTSSADAAISCIQPVA
jgi:hypothetical protein